MGTAFKLNGPSSDFDPSFGFSSGDFVAIPDAASLTPQSITLDAWILVGAIDGLRPIVTKYGDDLQTSWVFDLISDGRLRLEVLQDFFTYRAAVTLSPLDVGTWHHVAGTFDLGTQELALYIDGVEQPISLEGSTISGIMDSTTDVRIGTYVNQLGGFEGFFEGLIDEVEMFNRALTAEEIKAIFDAGSAGKCE